MSKQTRPKSRSERRNLRESQVNRQRPVEKRERTRPTSAAGKLRWFVPAVGVADVLLIVTAIVLAFAGVMIFGAPLATLPAAIAEMWMIPHLVPFVYEGVAVGLLPVLPTMGVIAVVASRVRVVVRAKVSVVDLGIVLATVLIVPIVVTLIAWVMLWDAAKVFPVEPPPLVDSLLRVLAVHATAFVLGVGSRLWRALFERYRLPRALVDGAKDASRFFQLLCAAALLLIVVLAVLGFERQQEALDAYPAMGTGAVLGLIALTLLYLPNAVFIGASLLLGGDFVIGSASVSLFSVHLVPLPPAPLTALIPGSVHPWAPALLLIVAILACVVWVQARPRPMQVLGGTLSIGTIFLVANYFTSGELGWYGWTGPTWWIAPLLAMVWLGGAGLATLAALTMTQRRQALRRQREREAAESARENERTPERDQERDQERDAQRQTPRESQRAPEEGAVDFSDEFEELQPEEPQPEEPGQPDTPGEADTPDDADQPARPEEAVAAPEVEAGDESESDFEPGAATTDESEADSAAPETAGKREKESQDGDSKD